MANSIDCRWSGISRCRQWCEHRARGFGNKSRSAISSSSPMANIETASESPQPLSNYHRSSQHRRNMCISTRLYALQIASMVVIVTPETGQYCSPIIRHTSKPSPISTTPSSKIAGTGIKYSETAKHKSAPPNSNTENSFLLTRLMSPSRPIPYTIGARQDQTTPTSQDRHESSDNNPIR